MKTLPISVLLILGLIVHSCNSKKEENKMDDIVLNPYDTLDSPPPLAEYYKDKKLYVIPSVSTIGIEDFNPVFSELLRDKKIIKINRIIKKNRLFKSSVRNIYNLYYKKSTPKKAGEYINDGDFFIYDFIYINENQYKIACDNLKKELQKLNIEGDYEYYDYFDMGGDCIYFFDNKKRKITILNPNQTDKYNIVTQFIEKNKKLFDEIIYASPTNMKIIK